MLVDAVEEVGVTSTEDSPARMAWAGAGRCEPLKARTAACAAADAAFSIASFKDPCTMDCTWLSCGADKSPSAGDSRSSSSWTWRWSCWSCISRAGWFAMCSPPSWIGGGVPERFAVFSRASSIRLIRAARPPVVRRLSRLHKDRKSLTYSLPSSRSAGRWPGSANVEVFLFGE